ncbi:MAG TPA: site-2 protease family protein [Jatrophihabitans sp.]
MLYALGVVVFAIGLLVSIALHEVGHMLPAKKFGVKVPQYMVGFGPTVWSRTRGETEYGLKALPVGGYVRLIGMVPPADLRSPRVQQAGRRWPRWSPRLRRMVEEYRAANRRDLDPADEGREFWRLTPGKKIVVMVSGPLMNLLIFLVLMVVLLGGVGLVHDDPTTTIGTVTKCVTPANATQAQVDACTQTNSPAAVAGFKPGDRVVAINGTAVSNWDEVISVIERSPGQRLSVVVDRAGHQLTLTPTPVQNLKYVEDTDGNVTDQTHTVGFLGVSSTVHHYYKPVSLTAIPRQVLDSVGAGFSALGQYPAKLKSLWQTVFEGKPRDPEGAIGVVGVSRIGGDIASSNEFGFQDKVVTLLGLLASVNLLLFLFNMLPLLPLDGGHVVGAVVEAGKRGYARLKGRSSRRIFVDTAQMAPIMYAVAVVLIGVTLLTFYADIVHPVKLVGG